MHLNACFIRMFFRIGRIFPRIPCKNNQFDSICENVIFSESPKCQWIESFTVFISFRMFHLKPWNSFERRQYYWKNHLFTFYLCAFFCSVFCYALFQIESFLIHWRDNVQICTYAMPSSQKPATQNTLLDWIELNWWMHLSLEIKHFCLSK